MNYVSIFAGQEINFLHLTGRVEISANGFNDGTSSDLANIDSDGMHMSIHAFHFDVTAGE